MRQVPLTAPPQVRWLSGLSSVLGITPGTHEKVKSSIFPVLDLIVDELELAELEGFKVGVGLRMCINWLSCLYDTLEVGTHFNDHFRTNH
jgi:hypothetical protein